MNLYLVLFVLLLYFPTTAKVMAGRSVHVTIFFLVKLEQAINQYFVHILLLVTGNNPSWMTQRKGGEWPKNYFITNLHETHDPSICSQTGIYSQTRYRLCHAAQSLILYWKQCGSLSDCFFWIYTVVCFQMGIIPVSYCFQKSLYNWAMTCDLQCGILTCVDTDKPV